MEKITATYLIETPIDIEKAADILAGEQSSGTFVEVPGESNELKQRFRAKVENIQQLTWVDTPGLPGCHDGSGKYKRAHVTVSWPLENIGYNLPTLVSTIQGNLYELSQFSGLKLIDIQVPLSYKNHFRGPSFGREGCRKLTLVYDRPLIGTIIKPSIGMTPEQTAELVKILVQAGIDFIKDDELMANPPHSPFNKRVDAVMKIINNHAQHSGKKVMYAFNITDEMDAMLNHYEKVVASGGTAVMMSLNSIGLTGVKKIADIGTLAIHGHRNGWGMLNRHPLLGIDFCAYQKLWRLAGIDQIHVNGIKNKFWESDESVVSSIKACLEPFLEGFSVLPVISSGQWGGQAFETYELTKTIDVLYMAGGGIMAHPGGPGSGVKALQQAWSGAVAGKTLEDTASSNPEFAQSVKKFGKIS